MIKKLDYQNDDVYVEFAGGKIGLYSTDALLVLKPVDMLLKARSIHSDFIDIDKVIRHLFAEKPGMAMNVIRSNPTIMEDVTMPLDVFLDRGFDQQQSTDNGRSR